MKLSIVLLGELRIYVDGTQLSLPKSRRTRALLAFLIMTHKPHSRERLCELFWDFSEDVKGSLRWSLSKIRPLINIGDVERLKATRERVYIIKDDIHTDIVELRVKLQQNALSAAQLKTMASELEEPLLSCSELPDQRLFQEWLIAERGEINSLRCHVIAKLANHPELMLPEQLHWCKRWIENQPYSTEAAELLLLKLAQLGQEKEHAELLNTLNMRFKRAGINWTSAKNTCSIINNGNDSLNNHIENQQKINFCKTLDGVRLAFAKVGQGYPIVKTANWLTHLEHDWNAPIWSPLFKNIAKDHTLIRYDERGNGLSDWHVRDISFDAFTHDLEMVIAENQLNRFALLGISQGASVAIDYASKHPEKVSHLILFGGYPAGWRINACAKTIKEKEAIITLTEAGWGQENPAYRQIFTSTFMPSANKAELDWFNDFQKLTTSPQNAAKFLEVFSMIDVREKLSHITVPTLVIHSLRDQRIPVDVARAMAAAIPNAEFIELESDGHLLLGRESASNVFVDAIKQFINTH